MSAWEKLTVMETNVQCELLASYLQACGVEIVTLHIGRRIDRKVGIDVQCRQLAGAK